MKKLFLSLFMGIVCLSAMAQDYKDSPNYGKKIAVFGGSFSEIAASDVAKKYWAEVLGLEIKTFGIGGAGFSIETGADRYLPLQIDRALNDGVDYDIYLLWASTNDVARKVPASVQNTLIEECIEQIRKGDPDAKIMFFTSLPVPMLPHLAAIDIYVEGQVETCERMGVPCLNLFTESGINKWNALDFFQSDKLHLNEAGYNHIKETQARFIAGN